MHLIREEIERIAAGPVSPGYSVLILGGSGTGKEEIAQSLFAASTRAKQKQKMHPVSGAWLNMEPGMALTEIIGLEKGRSSTSDEYPGLVELFSEGAIFVDDFESAPRGVQEALLRIMAAPRGRPAKYRRVGGRTDRTTNTWLIFATNAAVEKLLKDERLREDLLYRFEDRVLAIPPLRQRPADFPAIARTIWDQLWEFDPARKVPLGLPAIRDIAARRLEWEGNVRTLRALLGLVVSMRSNPAHNASPPGDLVELVLSRGQSYRDWVGIVETEFFHTGEPLVLRILAADSAFDCLGPSRPGEPVESDLAPSELSARASLTVPGWDLFKRLVSEARRTKSGEDIRVSIRLARIVSYIAETGSITWEIARDLADTSENTAIGDLAALANHDLSEPRKRKPRGPGPALVLLDMSGARSIYIRNREFFI